MNIRELRELLEPYNPWWRDRHWYKHDPLLRNFYNSILKREPRLYYHLRRYISTPGAYGIITIRGPRRVGKTTLIKLLVKYLIEEKNVNPQSIFYISLDYEGLESVKLVELLEAIARWGSGDKYIFLDEASMYPGWAQALKNLYDTGLIENGRMKIIAAGSHSMDLAEAASKLRGRQGKLAQLFNLGGNLVHVPLRFSEVVEALRPEINRFLSLRRLRTPKVRFNMLQELAQGRIPDPLQRIHDEYFQLLQTVFEDYLIHGGYPKAIDEYYKNNYISKEFYSDVAELLVKDSEKAGLDPENLKRVLAYLLEPKRLAGPLDLQKPEVIGRDEEARPKGRFGLRNYLDYLRTTWTFFFAYPEEGKSGSCKPNYQGQPKNYILDPFIYHALYSYLNNIPDPFEYSKKMINVPSFKGRLVESVVAAHLLLAQQLFEHVPSVEYEKVLMYRPTREETQEADFILCIMKGDTQYRFVIESKYRRIPSHVVPEEGKIVLTKDTLKARNGVAYIPIPLFLMLF